MISTYQSTCLIVTSTIFSSLGNVHRFIGDQLAAMQHKVSGKICAICLSAIWVEPNDHHSLRRLETWQFNISSSPLASVAITKSVFNYENWSYTLCHPIFGSQGKSLTPRILEPDGRGRTPPPPLTPEVPALPEEDIWPLGIRLNNAYAPSAMISAMAMFVRNEHNAKRWERDKSIRGHRASP